MASTTTYIQARMLQLNRDLKIMMSLAAGIATKDYLHRRFFTNPNQKLLSHQVVDRRLTCLCRGGYVVAKSYESIRSNKKLMIYALGPRGVQEVCNSYNMEMDHIRTELPTAHKLIHELELSELIRVIWLEFEKKKYLLHYAHDDRVLKRLNYGKKKVYYPDLRLTLTTKAGDQLTLNVELDCGTKGGAYWMAKVSSWKDPTLMITLNEPRLNRLKGYVQQLNRTYPTGFAVASAFHKGGLTATQWIWLPGNNTARLKIL